MMDMTPDRPRGVATWRQTYRQLLHSAGARAPALRRSILGLLVAAAIQGLALACLFPVFDAVFHAADARVAWRWLTVMSVLAIIASVLRWRAQGFEYNGQLAAMSHAVRTRLGEQLRRMPLERLYDQRAGEINAVLLGNVDENFNYTLAIVNLVMLATVTPLVLATMALFVDWRLGIILLLIFPAITPLYRKRRCAFGRGTRLLTEAHQRTSADIVEYLQGLPVLRAARSAGARAATLQSGFSHLQKVQVDGHRQGAKPDVIIASIVEIGLQLVVAAGVAWVVNGTLDLAVLAAIMVIVIRFSEPMASLISYTMMLELVEAALERIESLLAVPPLPQHSPAAMPKGFEVRFEAVSFRYAQAADVVLDSLSAVFPAKGLTALVGPSGAGKSTVTRLLMRHADPQQGRVCIGGADLRQIPPEALNGLISAVFQDVYLFDDSILSNIRMARPTARDDEVREVIRAAQCADFIARLPQGWHTRLGDVGGRVSGGERQRISIARALLKDAPIVLLDEPTAALDAESEVAVQRAIDALVRDKTVVVIAHRLSTIAGADQILVLEDGHVVERGRHAELMAANGRYCSMWRAQQAAKDWHPGAAAEEAVCLGERL